MNAQPDQLDREEERQLLNYQLVLAARSHAPEVVNDLLGLLRPDMEGLIATWGKARRMNREDIEDAQQEAWLRLPAAVLNYDERRLTQEEGHCEGKTFVDVIARRLFVDCLRKEGRRQAHFEASVSVEAVLEGGRTARDRRAQSPDLRSQRQELWACYAAVCERMSAEQRTLWEDWLAGVRRRVTAGKLGVSVETVHNRRGKLQEWVREEMRAFDPAG